MRHLLPLMILFIGCVPVAHAQEVQSVVCTIPADQRPSLRVNVDVEKPLMDYSKTRADLKRFDINSVSPYGNEVNVHVNGLTRGAIGFETKTGLHWIKYEKLDQNCFWYSHVEITVKLKPTVYIAKEIGNGSCMYQAVMTHEMRHVDTDTKLAYDYQSILQDEIERFIQSTPAIGPYTVSQKQQAQDWLTKRLDFTVQSVFHRLNSDRLKRQALIDTKEEYERAGRICPDEAKKMQQAINHNSAY